MQHKLRKTDRSALGNKLGEVDARSPEGVLVRNSTRTRAGAAEA